ncbi:hypothetical protein FS842_007597 [Serendipita sp. 407]|nr:hypothetical protein FS842_007597 [Serendipita sp. 407]
MNLSPQVNSHYNDNRAPFNFELATARLVLNSSLEERMLKEQAIATMTPLLLNAEHRERELVEQLKAVRSEIWLLDTSINRNKQDLRSVETVINSISGLLHPIRCCPDDILAIIFTFACDIPARDYDPTAVRLSHVCKRWQRVAVGAHHLWSSIILELKPKHQLDHISARWKTYTERAKSVPISLYINDRGKKLAIFPLYTLSNSQSLARVDLRLSAESFQVFCAGLKGRRLPINELRLMCSEIDCDAHTWPLTGILGSFTGLKELSIAAVGCQIEPQIPTIPTLRSFNVHGWYKYFDIRPFLSRFVNLVTLSLSYFTSERDNTPVDSEPLELPCLEILDFMEIDWDDIFGHFILLAPKLKNVMIFNCSNSIHFPEFLSRHPSITKFDIRGMEGDLPNLLKHVPYLEELRSEHQESSLVWEKNDGIDLPFPKLWKLHFYDFDDEISDQIHSLIQLRRGSDTLRGETPWVALQELSFEISPDEGQKMILAWREENMFASANFIHEAADWYLCVQWPASDVHP